MTVWITGIMAAYILQPDSLVLSQLFKIFIWTRRNQNYGANYLMPTVWLTAAGFSQVRLSFKIWHQVT